MRGVDRRQFLRLSTIGAAPLVASCAPSPPARPRPVVIVGAGLAGLRAAELIRDNGRPVLVFEARQKPGGRVRTVRTPLGQALHGEAGAIRIPDKHRRVRELASRVGLGLIPFESGNGAALLRVAGTTIRVPDGMRSLAAPLALRADERGLLPRALLEKYVGDLPAGLDDPDAPREAFDTWRDVDRLSWPAWLAARGASPGAQAIMTAGGDSRELSALYVLRQYALLRDVRQYFKVDGGMDQLPHRLADSLGPIVQYGTAVTRLERAADRVTVTTSAGNQSQSIEASHVIVTVPCSTMERMAVSPGWSASKAAAIAALPYFPATRVLVETMSRFWHAEALSGTGRSDQPAETWDAAYDQAADHGLIAATVGGAIGHELAALPSAAAADRGLAIVGELFPAIPRESTARPIVTSWAAEPWSRGAFAVFRPGQMSASTSVLASREGRVHFAGEHTSAWMGWMEGALESAERVAREVLE